MLSKVLKQRSIQHLSRSFASVQRHSAFNKLSDKDIAHFETVLGSSNNAVITDSSEVAGYNIDWTKKYSGPGSIVLKPSSNEEVAEVLKYCNDKMLAVVPQGGNTGLVGGGVAVFDEIVLNMQRMNKILNFDKSYGIVMAEAGCILQDMHDYVNEIGYDMPLDLGAKGSCMIGGNLSTNAGGINFIRYNSLHANCVGLKVVLPNGRVLDNITNLRKDNTGYDLKHLFIGAEGTLGVITECALLCPSLPRASTLCMVQCKDFQRV